MFTKTFTVGILMLLLVKYGAALMCYTCTSTIGLGDYCDDPPDTSQIKIQKCSPLFKAECIKYTVQTPVIKTIHRGCTAKTDEDTCEVLRNGTEGSAIIMKILYCGTCVHDLCNSANINIVAGNLLLIILLTFAYL